MKHITVLEEAHNLLRRNSIDQSSESSNLLGKIFNYGDIVVAAYNEKDGFSVRKMKNAN